MLQGIFMVLKWIGIILLGILLAAILLLSLLFLLPVRYRISAQYDKEQKKEEFCLHLSWLFPLLCGCVVYAQKKMDYKIRILGIPLLKKKKRSSSQKQKAKQELKKKKNYTFRTVCDKIKKICAGKKALEDYLHDASHKVAFLALKKEVLHLLKTCRPKKLHGTLMFGFDDPYLTGKVLAFLSILYPWYGDDIDISPDFEHQILNGDIQATGKVRLGSVAGMVIRLYFKSGVMKAYEDLKKIGQ